MRRMMLATVLLLSPTTFAIANADASAIAPPSKKRAEAAARPQVTPELAESGTDGHALRGAPWAEPDTTLTLGETFGFAQIPAPVFELPPQDNEFYLAEDIVLGNGDGPNPLRFAVPFDVALDLTVGEWIPVENGRIWRTIVASSNATTARLRLTGIDLAAGHEMRLSAPGWEGSVVGPIEGVGEFGNGEIWSLALPTNEVLVEWFVPHGAEVKALPFTGAEYYHGYREIWKINEGGDGGDGGVAMVGSCHLDPICFSTWADESNATVRLIFGGALCSGQLTATTAADETPYVSTANHCISTQSSANSTQFNFFYRRNTCAQSAVASAGVNVTGSDLVVTHAPSDCTLLMIRPTLPAGIFWVGWNGASVGTGTASTCVHHPDGSYQRISFGTKNSNSFPCGNPTTNFSSLSWNPATQYGVTSTGVTEGGSSGSAIYRNSDQRMYGVLTCGGSACTDTAADDGYGRWDLAVSSGGFASPLAAGSDDTLEPNDSCAAAVAVNPGTSYSNLVVKRLDEDWYVLPVPQGSTVSMNMTFTHANGDVDVELYGSCGGAVALSRLGNTNNEVFTYTNSAASQSLLMRVFLGADTRNNYSFSFTVSTPAPVNDDCVTATIVGDGTFAFNTNGATNSTPAVSASCTDGAGSVMNRDVWYRYVAPCDGIATVSTCNLANFDTRIVVYASASCPNSSTAVLTCNDDAPLCGTASSVTFEVQEKFSYYVRLGSKQNIGGAGSIDFTCEPAAACPADVDGSGSVDASDLAAVLGAWGACSGCAADVDDSGAVDASDLAAVLGAWGVCP